MQHLQLRRLAQRLVLVMPARSIIAASHKKAQPPAKGWALTHVKGVRATGLAGRGKNKTWHRLPRNNKIAAPWLYCCFWGMALAIAFRAW
jgi:hypothetical protein